MEIRRSDDEQLKLAFHILSQLYPDARPSEVKRIIDNALETPEREADIELWAVLIAKEKYEDKRDKKTITSTPHDYCEISVGDIYCGSDVTAKFIPNSVSTTCCTSGYTLTSSSGDG